MRAAVLALLACASLARAQGIPPAEAVGVNLHPEPRALRALPAGRGLRLGLTLLPPGAIDPLPGGRPLRLALTALSLPTLGALPGGRALSVALPPEQTGADVLAPIATANFPAPQPLSVALVPPASPLAAIAKGNFPAPQPLSVTLVPPATPLAAIAQATFPDPQPLAVTLYAGEPFFAVATFAGVVPGFTLVPPVYTVQIVQAIPRRGVDFFDRRNPAGQTTLFASTSAAGGASACAAGASSGGTFQSVIAGPYPKDLECALLQVVSDPGGQGDVLAIGDFHMIFPLPGGTLSAAVNINSGPTFATLNGANASTFSLTGVTSAPRGTVPVGTPMRVDATAVAIGRPINFTLNVCTPGGVVTYRRANGNC